MTFIQGLKLSGAMLTSIVVSALGRTLCFPRQAGNIIMSSHEILLFCFAVFSPLVKVSEKTCSFSS